MTLIVVALVEWVFVRACFAAEQAAQRALAEIDDADFEALIAFDCAITAST